MNFTFGGKEHGVLERALAVGSDMAAFVRVSGLGELVTLTLRLFFSKVG